MYSSVGQTTIDLTKASGPGGIVLNATGNITASSNTNLSHDDLHWDTDKAATAHGVLYAIIALAVAPLDTLIAGALGRRWACVHGVSATLYFAFVIGAMVPGVLLSRQHVAVRCMLIMFLWNFYDSSPKVWLSKVY